MDFTDKYEARARSVALPDAQLGDIAALAGEAVVGATPKAIRLLTGGFSNCNVLLSFADAPRCVLRVCLDANQIRLEAALMRRVGAATATPVPTVLWEEHDIADSGLSALVMDYVEGVPLAIAEEHWSSQQCQLMCEQLARAAAGIHAIVFDVTGRLGADPAGAPVIVDAFADYSGGTLEYLAAALASDLFARRAGGRRRAALMLLLERRSELVEPPVPGQLAHCDFNQKNLLVRTRSGQPELTAVLDWEFAMAASGLLDLGNLLRFESESRAVQGERFAAAYEEAGGALVPDWRERAMFSDLLAQCTFLTDSEERPRTFATALGVIDRTLAALA